MALSALLNTKENADLAGHSGKLSMLQLTSHGNWKMGWKNQSHVIVKRA